jgi:putative sterol carrier protein
MADRDEDKVEETTAPSTEDPAPTGLRADADESEDRDDDDDFDEETDDSDDDAQPLNASSPSGHAAQAGAQHSSGAGQASSQGRPREEDRRCSSARELITEEVVRRAQNANVKLRSQLVGSILVQVGYGQERYLFDWSTEELKVGQAGSDSAADCTIQISEDNLLKIASGDLNPQIAMLSEKIKLQGRLSLAVYFFNLITPRHSGH